MNKIFKNYQHSGKSFDDYLNDENMTREKVGIMRRLQKQTNGIGQAMANDQDVIERIKHFNELYEKLKE